MPEIVCSAFGVSSIVACIPVDFPELLHLREKTFSMIGVVTCYLNPGNLPTFENRGNYFQKFPDGVTLRLELVASEEPQFPHEVRGFGRASVFGRGSLHQESLDL
jgi:hypothetical protein